MARPGETGERRGGVSDEEIRLRAPPVAGGREVRVGVFVLLGIASFLAVLFLLTDPATFRGRYMVATDVTDAGGIRRGDAVQMRGVNIGRVDDFELVGDGVRITLEIEGEWSVPSDSRTRLAGIDLLGGRTVEVIPGMSREALAEGAVMPGVAVDGVLDLAYELGAEARQTLDRVRGLLDEDAIASLHGSLADLGELMSSMSALVSEQRDEVAALSSSLVRSAERVENFTGSEGLERGLARADSTLAELRGAGESLARATDSFEAVVGRIGRGEGTLGRLATEETLYQNLNAALEEILFLARDVRENPDRYVRVEIF